MNKLLQIQVGLFINISGLVTLLLFFDLGFEQWFASSIAMVLGLVMIFNGLHSFERKTPNKIEGM